MNPRELLKKYLVQQHMMQLATVANGQPWCCTVYYVADDAYNLYWASWPSRRHSREIKQHNKVAVAIPVKFVNGKKVVGIQAEGTVEEIQPSPAIRKISAAYASKFKRDTKWVEDFVGGKTKHRLYKLTPASFVLFDEENFPDNTRHEIKI